MIELTEEQRSELDQPVPARVRDPKTNETYVLIPAEVYERIKELLYDDSPWTDEELDLLAADVDAMLDDDMAIEVTMNADRLGLPIGNLSPVQMQKLNGCLKAALELP